MYSYYYNDIKALRLGNSYIRVIDLPINMELGADADSQEVTSRVYKAVNILGRYAEDQSYIPDHSDPGVIHAEYELRGLLLDGVGSDFIRLVADKRIDVLRPNGFPYTNGEFKALVYAVLEKANQEASKELRIGDYARRVANRLKEYWERSGDPEDWHFVDHDADIIGSDIVLGISGMRAENMSRNDIAPRVQRYLGGGCDDMLSLLYNLANRS